MKTLFMFIVLSVIFGSYCEASSPKVSKELKDEIYFLHKKVPKSVTLEKTPPSGVDCFDYFRSHGSAHGQDFGWYIKVFRFENGWLATAGGKLITDVFVRDTQIELSFEQTHWKVKGRFKGKVTDEKIEGISEELDKGIERTKEVVFVKNKPFCWYDLKNSVFPHFFTVE